MTRRPNFPQRLRRERGAQGGLVTVATFGSAVEAQMGRARLGAHGVRAFVSDEHFSGLQPQLVGPTGGVRLQVRQGDAALAAEILSEAAPPDEDDHEEDGPRCPSCGRRYAFYGLPAQAVFLALLLLGLPLLFMDKRWVCRKCGHTWHAEAKPGERAHPYRAPRAGARARGDGGA